jgi:hypothetical protein
MNDQGRTYEGGLADSVAGADGGGYRNFVAYQHSLTARFTIVYVSGEVEVANPGVEARLSPILDENPDVLLLRLDLIQRPGQWPQRLTWVPAMYVAPRINDGPFETAQIIHGEVTVVDIPFTR